MKEKFSKRVQSIIKQSKEEAIELGHSYVGSEHILLGLLKVSSGKGKKILDIFNVNTIFNTCSIFIIRLYLNKLYTKKVIIMSCIM